MLRTIYEKLGGVVSGGAAKEAFKARVTELGPQLRYCEYNIGDKSAIQDLLSMRLKLDDGGVIGGDVERLVLETLEKQGSGDALAVAWAGHSLSLAKPHKLAAFATAHAQFEADLKGAADGEASLALHDKILIDCRDAIQVRNGGLVGEVGGRGLRVERVQAVKDEAAKGESARLGGSEAAAVLEYLAFLRLKLSNARYLIMCQAALGLSEDGKKAKPQVTSPPGCEGDRHDGTFLSGVGAPARQPGGEWAGAGGPARGGQGRQAGPGSRPPARLLQGLPGPGRRGGLRGPAQVARGPGPLRAGGGAGGRGGGDCGEGGPGAGRPGRAGDGREGGAAAGGGVRAPGNLRPGRQPLCPRAASSLRQSKGDCWAMMRRGARACWRLQPLSEAPEEWRVWKGGEVTGKGALAAALGSGPSNSNSVARLTPAFRPMPGKPFFFDLALNHIKVPNSTPSIPNCQVGQRCLAFPVPEPGGEDGAAAGRQEPSQGSLAKRQRPARSLSSQTDPGSTNKMGLWLSRAARAALCRDSSPASRAGSGAASEISPYCDCWKSSRSLLYSYFPSLHQE